MRQLIYQALTDSDDIKRIYGDPPRIYQLGSLGVGKIPAKPDFPYILISENPATVNNVVRDTGPKSHTRNFMIYSYDHHGRGYLRIEQGLRVVRDTLIVLTAAVSPSGARCTHVEWTGLSVDSRDSDYEANVKWATFKFVVQQ